MHLKKCKKYINKNFNYWSQILLEIKVKLLKTKYFLDINF